MEVAERARKIKCLAFDVDGVLTDGKIIIGPDGEWAKEFHARDGLGLSLARRAGLKTAVITGRHSEMVRRRCEELGLTAVYQGARDKCAALDELCRAHALRPDEICYVGDDLVDLAVMGKVGLACAVGDAAAEVKARAHYIAAGRGGGGAAREIVELVLKAQLKWAALVARYEQPGPAPAGGQ